jgi:hypothetical protein
MWPRRPCTMCHPSLRWASTCMRDEW